MNKMGACTSSRITPVSIRSSKSLRAIFHLWKGNDRYAYDLRVDIRGNKDDSPIQYNAIHLLLRTYGADYVVNEFTGQIAIQLQNTLILQTIIAEFEKVGVSVRMWSHI